MAAQWVDFHCHLDLYEDHANVIAECDRERWRPLQSRPRRKPGQEPGAGDEFRPCARCTRTCTRSLWPNARVNSRFRTLPRGRALCRRGRPGRGTPVLPSFPAQERVFERILRACAEHGDKILTVHSVCTVSKFLIISTARCLRIEVGSSCIGLRARRRSSPCRRSRLLLLDQRRDASVAEAPELVASLPADRLLTETDGPFVEFEGHAIRPCDVARTVADLAALRAVPAKVMMRDIIANLRALLTNNS